MLTCGLAGISLGMTPLIELTIKLLAASVLKVLMVLVEPPPEPSGANRDCVGVTFVAKGIYDGILIRIETNYLIIYHPITEETS